MLYFEQSFEHFHMEDSLIVWVRGAAFISTLPEVRDRRRKGKGKVAEVCRIPRLKAGWDRPRTGAVLSQKPRLLWSAIRRCVRAGAFDT